MEFYPGFEIEVDNEKLNFKYGSNTFGPEVEKRYLDDIRKSLRDQRASGPSVPYAIAMDVGGKEDKNDLEERNLLYGAVVYSKGKIGDEPVRSQGHIHAISSSCQSSTPEVYEIWQGEAIVYMQEHVTDSPGKCYAVRASQGEVVIVPPGWGHYTINANPKENMVFGAWCVRDYGFDYDEIRKRGGLAFFPVLDLKDNLTWIRNEGYRGEAKIIEKNAREYHELGIEKNSSIYTQYQNDNKKFEFVAHPQIAENIWENYIP